MLDLLFDRKTKWVPLAAYNNGGTDFIVLVRRGKKTNMLYFKTKQITPRFLSSYNFTQSLLNISEQFAKVLIE